jgi:hypothetical protein
MANEERTPEELRIALQKLRDPVAPASSDILEALQFARLETIDALMTFDLIEFDKLKRPSFAPLKALRKITRDLRGLTHEDDRPISLIGPNRLLNVLDVLNTKVRECDRQDLAYLIVRRLGDTHGSGVRQCL